MNRFWGWLLFIFCITLGSASAAEEVRVTGKSVWGDTDTEINYIEGDVRFVQGSTVITTEKARVDTKRKTALFEKGVKLAHPEVSIESETLEYDLKKESGTFRNNVVMERKRSKASKDKGGKDPFKLLTHELFFETGTKNFIAKNGRIEHKNFTGEADLIEYSDQKQELLLKENAKLIRPKGETIQGKQIKINISEKSFRVISLVSVEFEVEEESD